jgi:hypothetical protein
LTVKEAEQYAGRDAAACGNAKRVFKLELRAANEREEE